MEVKIQIEANQIGDTVIDLFKGLSPEKKEELALSVLKEWIKDPDTLETRNRKTILIEEFKAGKHNNDSYNCPKWNENSSDEEIINSYDFHQALRNYKVSKQIMLEDFKNEVVGYYKEHISQELKTNEKIEEIKNETFETLKQEFPSIIMNVLVDVFAGHLREQNYRIVEAYRCSGAGNRTAGNRT